MMMMIMMMKAIMHDMYIIYIHTCMHDFAKKFLGD